MSTITDGFSPLAPAVALVTAIGLGAGGLLFGFVLTYIAAGLLVIGFGVELTAAMAIVVGLVFTQGVGCAGVALAYVTLRSEIRPAVRDRLGIVAESGRFHLGAAIPDLRDVLVVVGGYALAFGGAIAGALTVVFYQSVTGTEVDTGTNQAAELGMQNPEVLLLLIPASILIIGPGEELLFRGVVQGRLREVFSPSIAVLIASVVFAGLHWFALTGGSARGNLIALGILVIPSVVFGASYEYTDNIVVPSLIHGVYNATLFSLLYVSITHGENLAEANEAALAALSIA